VDRRLFLTGALGVSVAGLAGCFRQPEASVQASLAPPTVAAPVVPVTYVSAGPDLVKVPYPGGPVFALPGEGNLMAWTVDDGASYEAIAGYARFCAQTQTRLTCFITASYPAWREAEPLLSPLIATGQVQLANHTFSHPSLTSLSDGQIQDELMRAHDVIVDIFGVDVRPWYRPPYGNRNARTDAAAAAVGYTAPIMWYGTLGDAINKTGSQLVAQANQWFLPQSIVLGHVNDSEVTTVFPELHQIVVDRGLTTVTLNDVFTM